jgi:predicted dehydrogenase
VVVATTAPSHADLVCHAAECGAQVILCEKPMAVSIAECDRMIAACEAAGTRLAINHQMRFMEQYTRIKDMLASDDFGGLSSATVIAGNFGLAMNGSHYFEAFRFLTDEPASRVSARFSEGDVPNPRGPQFRDKAGAIRVETASGKRLYIEASADQGHGIAVVYASRFGRVFVDELTGAIMAVHREPEHRELPTTRYGMPWVEITERIAPTSVIEPTKRVLQSLLEGGAYPTGADGLAAVRVLVAAYMSAEAGGEPVDLATTTLDRTRAFAWA